MEIAPDASECCVVYPLLLSPMFLPTVWTLQHPTRPWEQLQPQFWLVLDGHWLYIVYVTALHTGRVLADTLWHALKQPKRITVSMCQHQPAAHIQKLFPVRLE